jgi:hypothetical protein
VEQGDASLERLPRVMRDAVAEALEPNERIVALWTTRGLWCERPDLHAHPG